jgi:hypothetical protein
MRFTQYNQLRSSRHIQGKSCYSDEADAAGDVTILFQGLGLS